MQRLVLVDIGVGLRKMSRQEKVVQEQHQWSKQEERVVQDQQEQQTAQQLNLRSSGTATYHHGDSSAGCLYSEDIAVSLCCHEVRMMHEGCAGDGA